jgi:hypothetical protein
MSEKSCFTCSHIHQIDSEWQCIHPSMSSFPFVEPSKDILNDDQKYAQYCAQDCPGYELKIVELEQQSELEEDWEYQMPTPEEIAQWKESEANIMLIRSLMMGD